jgi:hypothetical protein
MAATTLRARRESSSREESFQETMVDATEKVEMGMQQRSACWSGWGVSNVASGSDVRAQLLSWRQRADPWTRGHAIRSEPLPDREEHGQSAASDSELARAATTQHLLAAKTRQRHPALPA